MRAAIPESLYFLMRGPPMAGPEAEMPADPAQNPRLRPHPNGTPSQDTIHFTGAYRIRRIYPKPPVP